MSHFIFDDFVFCLRNDAVESRGSDQLLKPGNVRCQKFLRNFICLRIGLNRCENSFKKESWIFQMFGSKLKLFSLIA